MCSIEGCERPVLARGWCKKHYTRWYTYGDPTFSKAEAKLKQQEKKGMTDCISHPNHNGEGECLYCLNEELREKVTLYEDVLRAYKESGYLNTGRIKELYEEL